jgi:hypothetical protein
VAKGDAVALERTSSTNCSALSLNFPHLNAVPPGPPFPLAKLRNETSLPVVLCPNCSNGRFRSARRADKDDAIRFSILS